MNNGLVSTKPIRTSHKYKTIHTEHITYIIHNHNTPLMHNPMHTHTYTLTYNMNTHMLCTHQAALQGAGPSQWVQPFLLPYHTCYI